MAESLTKIKASYNCEDESFQIEKSSDYQLFIQLGPDTVALSVLDLTRNKFILLKVFPVYKAFGDIPFIEKVKDIFQQNAWINSTFKGVNVSFVNTKYTLIPAPLYEKVKEREYLSFNHQLDANALIFSDFIKNGDAYVVFSLSTALHDFIVNTFKNVKIHHFATSIIDQVLAQYKNQSGRKVSVHVQSSHFEVMVTEGRKLIFFNTFQHQTSEDFIYYLLFVCEQLELNPEELDLVLLGEVEKNSALYQILHKFIRNISFGLRNDTHQFCYKLDTLPSHFYYSLFSQSLADH